LRAQVALAVISYVRPAGDGESLPTYSAIEPMRDFLWAFFVVAGVNLVVGVCAVAIAGWVLTPARGAASATVGGSLIWLGAAVYGVGIGGCATVYYFASDKVALDPAHRRNHRQGRKFRDDNRDWLVRLAALP
jgi:hypothetical protein